MNQNANPTAGLTQVVNPKTGESAWADAKQINEFKLTLWADRDKSQDPEPVVEPVAEPVVTGEGGADPKQIKRAPTAPAKKA